MGLSNRFQKILDTEGINHMSLHPFLKQRLLEAVCFYLKSPEGIEEISSSVSAYYYGLRYGDYTDKRYTEMIVEDLCEAISDGKS